MPIKFTNEVDTIFNDIDVRRLYAKGTSGTQGLIRLERNDASAWVELFPDGEIRNRRLLTGTAGDGRVNIRTFNNSNVEQLNLGVSAPSINPVSWGMTSAGDAIHFRDPTGVVQKHSIYSAFYTSGTLNHSLVIRGHHRLELGVFTDTNSAIQIVNLGNTVINLPGGAGTGWNQTYNHNNHALMFMELANGRIWKQSIDLSTLGGDNLGNHTATQNLDMDDNDIIDVSMITFSDLNLNGNKWSLFENAENGAFEAHIANGVPTRKFRIQENGEVEFGGVKYPIATGSAGQVLTISSAGQAAWSAPSSLTFDLPMQLSSGNVAFNIVSLSTPTFSGSGPSYRHLDSDQFIFRDTNANPANNRQTQMLHIREATQSRITTVTHSGTSLTMNHTGSNGDIVGKFNRLTNANTVTVTMEASTTNWPPVGSQYIFFREGGSTNATVNFNRGTGVAFTSRAGNVNLKTTQVGESVTFIYLGSNVYAVLGDSIAQ